MKRPSFQFYPGDWRRDPGVQALDFHDRGVWFEILCLMHESDERGVLLLNGSPMPEVALARVLGLDKQILTTTLTALLEFGVASKRAEDGALYCRRMVRDEELTEIRRKAGKQGGNPALLKQKATTKVNQIPTPSSSSSSSSSKHIGEAASDDTPDKPPAVESPGQAACPQAEILALYHEVLPELRKHKVWTGKREAQLRVRWREDPKRQTLEYWRKVFEYVRESDFLMGRVIPKDPGAAPFLADLEFLTRADKFAGLIEGKYHGRRDAA